MSHHTSHPPESPEEAEAKARVLRERMQMGFNMIPFNQVIGLQITDISLERERHLRTAVRGHTKQDNPPGVA